MPQSIVVNEREYRWPDRPLVVVCIDGSEPSYPADDPIANEHAGGYIERAVADGQMPFMASMLTSGSHYLANCVIPSFTNPNNLSIVTGAAPAVHGICGNYFYDQDNDQEVMMNDPKLLRSNSILAAFNERGAKVAIITAKDKLRALLGHGVKIEPGKAVCFSAEKADQCNTAVHGIDNVLERIGRPLPSVYSADLSEFVFAAGVELSTSMRPDLMYLSTTDYVQHKFAPGSDGANAFYAMMDGYLQTLDTNGYTLALTADHGMNAKHASDGTPNIIYLQKVLDQRCGEGSTRVILPITDPYVVHHGALGGFATVYLADEVEIGPTVEFLASISGLECVLTREEACTRFSLPPDRIGDIVAISDRKTVIGTRAENHDLSALDVPLRSHGGLSEGRVPLLLNRPSTVESQAAALNNYDIFDLALNRV